MIQILSLKADFQLSQLSCGVREILEIHTQLLAQLDILLARWEQVGFPISYLIVRLLLMVGECYKSVHNLHPSDCSAHR